MEKIRRNSMKKIAAFAERVISVKSHNLGNDFRGVECIKYINENGGVFAFIKKEFSDDHMKRTTMCLNDAGNNLSLRIHSNQWYELEMK